MKYVNVREEISKQMPQPLLSTALRVLSCYREGLAPLRADVCALRESVAGTPEETWELDRLADYIAHCEREGIKSGGSIEL
jgi:hypothetical protein